MGTLLVSAVVIVAISLVLCHMAWHSAQPGSVVSDAIVVAALAIGTVGMMFLYAGITAPLYVSCRLEVEL